MSADGDTEVGRRSSSPPGKESREDWKGGERKIEEKDEPLPASSSSKSPSSKPDKERSRSRSPRRSRSPVYRRNRDTNRNDRDRRYQQEGTQTSSHEPHLKRARLFVGNIEHSKTNRKDIADLFSRYGDVLGVSVHKGFAFVQMDRERNANRAINGEDNRNFMGSRIHVEFSQAALDAGAKFERIPMKDTSPPDVLRSYRSSRALQPALSILEIEREREERLSRILTMERELSVLRAREDGAYRRPPLNEAAYDRYDVYRRERSPVKRESDYLSQQDYLPRRSYPPESAYLRPGDYSRNERPGYEGSRSDIVEREREYYNGRSSDIHSSLRGGGGAGSVDSRGSSVSNNYSSSTGAEAYRHPAVSYPIPGRGVGGGYQHRDSSSQYSAGLDAGVARGGGGVAGGYGSRVGGAGGRGSDGGYGPSSTSLSVGYGITGGGGKVGMGGAPPPGWPSSDYDKSNANRPPFAWN